MDSYDFNKVNNNIAEFQQITKYIKGTVVVKGKNDLILSSSKFRINRSGNAGMTVGGTGDALAGIITALLSQGINTFDYENYGNGFSATNLVSFIGNVIKNGLC